jgi:hypothetical protein
MLHSLSKYTIKLIKHWLSRCGDFWRAHWWHKVVVIIAGIIVVSIGGMYGIAEWYIWSQRDTPLTMGVSFIPDYATSLGLNPEQTMDALISDLHVKQFRLVSYWSDIEPTEGHYDFTQLDWEFQKADAAHAKVSLSIGLRQPRWPECHSPSWINTSQPVADWQPQLEAFMQTVINRYKQNPALQSYQLENEYFLTAFGECTNFSRDRLVSEYNLVKQTDPSHPVIISRSNNDLGIAVNAPTPDEYGVSVYKRVWSTPLGRYIEYPFPAWYYGFLAGLQEITQGRNLIIHELQAEAWPPHGQSITSTSLAEQDKSINAKRLTDRFQYGKATGIKTIDLWGAEYWYYRMEILHDPSLWNVAKQEFNQN